ncbi:MAG: hypothetical protein QM605_13695 [Sphingobium sp.]
MRFGDSIRKSGPDKDTRFCHVVLLYIGVKRGVWNVNRWFAPIGKEGLGATEERLLRLARSRKRECECEFQGHGFENIRFVEYPSYFTIVLDAPGYDFQDDKGTDPMWFVEKKVNSLLPPPPAPVVPNRTFYDLETTQVGGFPALRCRNYLRNSITGEPLKKDEEQGFIFNIYLQARYAHGGDNGVTLVIDPDGTSRGPDR